MDKVNDQEPKLLAIFRYFNKRMGIIHQGRVKLQMMADLNPYLELRPKHCTKISVDIFIDNGGGYNTEKR